MLFTEIPRRLDLSLLLLIPIAQSGSTGEAIREIFDFNSSDPDMTQRFLLATFVVITLSLLFWFLNSTSSVWSRWLPGARRRQEWDQALRSRGLAPDERSFVTGLARQIGIEDIHELIRSRVSFENAVTASKRWVEAEGRRIQELHRVRRRLSWESASGSRSQEVRELLEHNLEVEIFGTADDAGFCVRATLVHHDADALVFRLEDLEQAPWQQGARVRVYFWRQNDAGYLFDTTILELRSLGEMFLFVKPPTQLERHQRRLHVRVPMSDPVNFLRVSSGEASDWFRGEAGNEPGPLRGGIIEDLSAGGFQIRVSTALQVGDFLSFDDFPVVEGSEILARLVSERFDDATGSYHYGAQFLGMSAVMRDRISQHVFRLQRENIRGRDRGSNPSLASPPPHSND